MADVPDVYARFEGLVGECMDDQHLGSDGWIQIKSFSFGFGFASKDGGSGDTMPDLAGKDPAAQAKAWAEWHRKQKEAGKKAQSQKGQQGWGKSGALEFRKARLSKNSDRMSKDLLEICHSGEVVPEVKIVAVRQGSATEGEKVEFVIITFQTVYIKTCSLQVPPQDLPSEEIEFEYDVVKLESRWTNNATGDRRPELPEKAGWDVTNNKAAP